MKEPSNPMPDRSIENDATIADIAGKLNKGAEYVRRVLDNMWDCKRAHGDASVRIGTMGEGRAPNYLIEYPRDKAKAGVCGAYSGLGHNKIENFDTSGRVRLEPVADRTLMREHWSSEVMSLKEVSEFLYSLRKRKH
jgi:hypothetical protein